MLKARDHKKHDRKKDRPELSSDVLCGSRHPDGEADQKIAENSEEQEAEEGPPHLARGDLYGHAAKLRSPGLELPAVHHDERCEDASYKVSDVDKEPVLQHGTRLHLTVQHAHEDQAVPGKKLRSCQYDHHKPRSKDRSCDRLPEEEAVRGGQEMAGRKVRALCAKRDEDPGEDSQNQHLEGGKTGLHLSRRDGFLRDLLRCQKQIVHTLFLL